MTEKSIAVLEPAVVAEERWNDLPDEVQAAIVEMQTALLRSVSGPETLMSFDAVINEWLAPYGLAQRTDARSSGIVTHITTLEALRELV